MTDPTSGGLRDRARATRTGSDQRIHRIAPPVVALIAVAVCSVAAALIGSGVIPASFTQSTHPAGPSESHPSHTPVTEPDARLIDHTPAPAGFSSMLPEAGGDDPVVIIPSLGVRSIVVPEGIDTTPGDEGNLTIPGDVTKVAWWAGGPAPGQPGTAVLASHRAQSGVFWRLPELHAGDDVEVVGTNGQTTRWTVTGVEQQLKAELPAEVWRNSGPPRLALVTCGGVFNHTIGHYNDNVIVWAAPA